VAEGNPKFKRKNVKWNNAWPIIRYYNYFIFHVEGLQPEACGLQPKAKSK
jgi:hypothetical protein